MKQLDLQTDSYVKQFDAIQDGYVSYLEFLNYHLRQAGLPEEKRKDGQKIQDDFKSLRNCQDLKQIQKLAEQVFS